MFFETCMMFSELIFFEFKNLNIIVYLLAFYDKFNKIRIGSCVKVAWTVLKIDLKSKVNLLEYQYYN